MTITLNRKYYLKQNIVKFAIALLVLAFVSMIVIPVFSYADIDLPEDDATLSLFSVITDEFGDGASSLTDIINGTTRSEEINSIIHGMSLVLKVIASVLVFIYFIYAVTQSLTESKNASDAFISFGLKFAIAFVLIAFGDRIFHFFTDGLALVIDEVIGLLNKQLLNVEQSQSAELFAKIVEAKKTGTLETAMETWDISKPVFVIYMLSLYVKIQKYSIVLEIFLRETLFPLVAVTVINDGLRSPAVRFLKKYLAIYVRIAIMYFVLFLGLSICTAVMTGSFVVESSQEISGLSIAFYDVIAIFAACSALIGKGGRVANQIVGVE